MIYTYDKITKEYLGNRSESTDPTDETNIQPPPFTNTCIGMWNGTSWDLGIRPNVFKGLIDSVNVEREKRLDELIVTFGSFRFDANPVSIANLSGILTGQASGVPISWPLTWRDADNINRSLSNLEAVQLAGLMMQAINVLYACSWNIKDNIIPALTVETVDSFDITDDAHWTI